MAKGKGKEMTMGEEDDGKEGIRRQSTEPSETAMETETEKVKEPSDESRSREKLWTVK